VVDADLDDQRYHDEVNDISVEWSQRMSECCRVSVTHYNRDWKDGICKKCGFHTPTIPKLVIDV
jgi:hypothetical protein